MKILITGAAGFIGSHLGNRLVELGHQVLGVDDYSNPSQNKLEFQCESLHYLQYAKENDLTVFDVIFHLAASINVDESIDFPEKYFNNNTQGTFLFLEQLRKFKFKGKFIYASSAEVYGTAQTQRMSEDHPLVPLSPYACSKLAAEQFARNYSELYGLNITVIRNFNTFGPYQGGGMYGGVIAKFKKQAEEDEPITVYGSGEQMRDYMHISQAISGYVLAMEQKMPTVVNFGAGVPIKIIDIANFIAKRKGARVIHTTPRPNEILRLEADISRAVAHGYKVETDFWKHLEDFIDF